MIQIMLEGAGAKVMEGMSPDGQPQVILAVEDEKSGIAVVIPMPLAAATQLGNAMAGRSIVRPGGPGPILPPG